MGKYLSYAPHLFLVILLGWNAYTWYHDQGEDIHYVTPPSLVEGIDTHIKPCTQIVYLDKPEAEKKDLVPEYARRDDDKQVTAVIEVPPHKAETVITSVFDMSSGLNTLSYRQTAESYLGKGYKELGLMYGIDGTVVVNGRWEPLRLGRWYLKIETTIDSEAEAFIGVGVLRRWG